MFLQILYSKLYIYIYISINASSSIFDTYKKIYFFMPTLKCHSYAMYTPFYLVYEISLTKHLQNINLFTKNRWNQKSGILCPWFFAFHLSSLMHYKLTFRRLFSHADYEIDKIRRYKINEKKASITAHLDIISAQLYLSTLFSYKKLESTTAYVWHVMPNCWFCRATLLSFYFFYCTRFRK